MGREEPSISQYRNILTYLCLRLKKVHINLYLFTWLHTGPHRPLPPSLLLPHFLHPLVARTKSTALPQTHMSPRQVFPASVCGCLVAGPNCTIFFVSPSLSLSFLSLPLLFSSLSLMRSGLYLILAGVIKVRKMIIDVSNENCNTQLLKAQLIKRKIYLS